MPTDPRSHVYVLKLTPVEGDASVLRGRVEHIASGRRHDFHSTPALIDCLRHEEQQVKREQGTAADSDPRDH